MHRTPHPTADAPTAPLLSGAVHDRLQRLGAVSGDVLFTAQRGPEGVDLLWVSPASVDVLGMSARTLQAIPDGLLLHAHPDDWSLVRAALGSKASTSVDYRWRRSDPTGPWTKLRLDVVPVPDQPDLVDGCVRSTEGTHQITSRLQSAVDHETRALAQLHEVEELRTHITRSLSHRVRTPLAILRACTETALDPPAPLTEVQRDDLFARISRATSTLESLLHDLLDLPTATVLDLTDQTDVLEVVHTAARATLDGTHHLDIDVDQDLRVATDATSLRRCVSHLIANAVRHTPLGTPIHVRAAHRAPDQLVIQVADEGPGLPRHVTARLFEPFVTGQDGADPGLGIGLAVVHHLVTQLGGTIEVESGDDTGTRVTLVLPDDRSQTGD